MCGAGGWRGPDGALVRPLPAAGRGAHPRGRAVCTGSICRTQSAQGGFRPLTLRRGNCVSPCQSPRLHRHEARCHRRATRRPSGNACSLSSTRSYARLRRETHDWDSGRAMRALAWCERQVARLFAQVWRDERSRRCAMVAPDGPARLPGQGFALLICRTVISRSSSRHRQRSLPQSQAGRGRLVEGLASPR